MKKKGFKSKITLKNKIKEKGLKQYKIKYIFSMKSIKNQLSLFNRITLYLILIKLYNFS